MSKNCEPLSLCQLGFFSSAPIKTYSNTRHKPYLQIILLTAASCLQPFPSCHMDSQSQFLLVFFSSAPLKTYPKTHLNPYLYIILLTAASRFQLFPSCHMDGPSQFLLVFLSSAPPKTYPKTCHKPYIHIILLTSCHMDGRSQFLLVFLSLAPLKTYPKTCHKPYLHIILLTAASCCQPFSAVSQLPYGWSDTILFGIFELSTLKNLPKDTSQALSTHNTHVCRQPLPAVFRRFPAAIWMVGHNSFWYF